MSAAAAVVGGTTNKELGALGGETETRTALSGREEDIARVVASRVRTITVTVTRGSYLAVFVVRTEGAAVGAEIVGHGEGREKGAGSRKSEGSTVQ